MTGNAPQADGQCSPTPVAGDVDGVPFAAVSRKGSVLACRSDLGGTCATISGPEGA